MFDKKYNLENDGAAMSFSMGKAFCALSKILKKKNQILFYQDLTFANFAVTVCGAHMNIPVAHIQGGKFQDY